MRLTRPTARPALVLAAALAVLALAATACGGGGGTASPPGTGAPAAGDRPTIVATTSVLGAVVSQLVGDRATVEVLIPDGTDPHDFQPSARDAAALVEADLIVANGLGLEQGVERAIDQASSVGVPVFVATDHITLRTIGEDEAGHGHAADDGHGHEEDGHGHEGEAHTADDGHDHGSGDADPHFWVDPVAMAQAAEALAGVAQAELGLDLAAPSAALQADLAQLDARTRATLAPIPADHRLLVTGHESLGYLADRYGFTLVGSLIPATTSQAAPSAADLAALKAEIERAHVPAVFNELGTPPALSAAIAEETGVRVVELSTHTLPPDGTYASFIDALAGGVRDGLAP